MALNSSGPISLAGTTAGQSIELENGGNGTTQISLNDAAVRTLAGVPSGAITMPTNFWGKSNRVAISYTIGANVANTSINLTSLVGYSSGKTDFTVTVNSGIYVYSTSVGSYALNLTGGTTGDTLTLVNNGYIMGQGGNGGAGQGTDNLTGNAGGPAINFGFGMSGATVNNTNASAYIGGGGGGGSGGVGSQGKTESRCGGGGGVGGGNGGVPNGGPYPSGGQGGSIGASGTGAGGAYDSGRGGGGGRVFPGVGAPTKTSSYNAGSNGGTGGGGGCASSFTTGGAGGSSNSSGANITNGGGGGGGGWGASGGNSISTGPNQPFSGGAGGKAVNLNGKSVTWTSGNTTRVWGTVS